MTASMLFVYYTKSVPGIFSSRVTGNSEAFVYGILKNVLSVLYHSDNRRMFNLPCG